jgi:OOP family OmpA-OmpF porin
VSRGASAVLGVSFWVAVAAAPGAFAQDAGFSLGGSLGQATLKEWCDTSGAPAGFVLVACDDKDSAWKLFGGYSFNRYFGLEATYINWGEATGTVGGPQHISAEQTSMGIAAVGSLPLGPQFSVFGKAGFLVTEQEVRSSTSSTTTEGEETEFHFGLGARFRFTPGWAARAEWERTDKLKVEMLSIGVEYRF